MGVAGSVVSPAPPPVQNGDETSAALAFDIRGDDLGIIIGRRGQTLASLQYIVRLIVNNQVKSWVPIVVDVEGYKQRRYQALRALALRMAEQVKVREAPFTLEPMPAYERRIVHLALADHPDVITQSVGEGEFRKVVILPKE
jgi:spoIIIJ-associated protein